MLSTSLISKPLQEEQITYQLTTRIGGVIAELNDLIFKPVCSTNYDITNQIPLWIIYEKTERESSGVSGLSIFDFLQKYYDWLYCDESTGAQYSLSKSFLDIIDVDRTQSAFVERLASIYASGFDSNFLQTNNGTIYEENLRNFIKGIRTFFYQRKTTEDGIRYFFKTLFNIDENEISIQTPKKFILRLNGGRFYDSNFSFPNGKTGPYETLGALSGSYLNGSRMQDGNWIQDWSYLLKVGISTNNYKQLYLNMAHPAGLRVVFEKTLSDYVGPVSDQNTGNVCELPMLKNYSAYGISFDYSNYTTGIVYNGAWSGSGITFVGLPSTRGCTSGYTGFTGPAYVFPNWTEQTLTYNFQGINISTMLEMCYPSDLGSPNSAISACT